MAPAGETLPSHSFPEFLTPEALRDTKCLLLSKPLSVGLIGGAVIGTVHGS